jgi:NADPH-dependent curcumin reductase CurA
MPPTRNRQVRLKARPEGIPQAQHFEIAAAPLPEVGDAIAGLYRGENLGKRLIKL